MYGFVDIPGFEGYYKINMYGDVMDIRNNYGKIRTISLNKTTGYHQITLRKGSATKTYGIHKLLAITFIPNEFNKEEVNHKDGDKSNNSLGNLERCTSSENMIHAVENGLLKIATKKVEGTPIGGGTPIIFNSIKEASEYVGGFKSNICNCCRGLNKSAYGYSWQYI